MKTMIFQLPETYSHWAVASEALSLVEDSATVISHERWNRVEIEASGGRRIIAERSGPHDRWDVIAIEREIPFLIGR